MSTELQRMTADQLMAMPDDGFRYELINGELIGKPLREHLRGRLSVIIAASLHQHVTAHNLGIVYAAGTGFLIHQNPDTVRAPDAAFVRRERLENRDELAGYWVGAPDLVVEFVSPTDSVGYLEDKFAEWIDAGSQLVWVVSPTMHSVTVYRSLSETVVLTKNDTLDGDDVVPGFQVSIAEIFAE